MQRQFRYKAWANAELIDAIGQLDATEHADAQRAAIRLLNHTYVVDRIFAAHMTGEPHGFDATNTTETPTLDALAASIRASDAWYEDYAAKLSDAERDERIAFTFTDGQRGAMTREEMLFHLLAHGAYHRGNIGMILSGCDVDRPKDTFTRFLHAVEPERR